jgi:hypothetical protein
MWPSFSWDIAERRGGGAARFFFLGVNPLGMFPDAGFFVS